MSATAPITRTNGDILKKEVLMKMSFTETSSTLSSAQTFSLSHTHTQAPLGYPSPNLQPRNLEIQEPQSSKTIIREIEGLLAMSDMHRAAP